MCSLFVMKACIYIYFVNSSCLSDNAMTKFAWMIENIYITRVIISIGSIRDVGRWIRDLRPVFLHQLG